MKISSEAAAKRWYALRTANIRRYKIRGQKQTTSLASIVKPITLVDVPGPKPGAHIPAEGVSHLFLRKCLSVPYPNEQLDIQEDVEQLLAPDASKYTALLEGGVQIAQFIVTTMLMYARRHIESTGQAHPMSTDNLTLPLKAPDVPFVWDSGVKLSLFEEVPRLDSIHYLYISGRPDMVLRGQPNPIKDGTPDLVHFYVQHKPLHLDSEAQLMFYLYMAWYCRQETIYHEVPMYGMSSDGTNYIFVKVAPKDSDNIAFCTSGLLLGKNDSGPGQELSVHYPPHQGHHNRHTVS
ncbi:hypothetical protein BDV39DRAFT_200171 [Aspergillus sergii]|uniref:Uncharacterized protein n=1 Tax=Aspergillus sergii TaxID=1034303 RepID=A0A5N6XLT1_9EURO|nr:hypothetical protein BDV39DRAFT_200171 [Aspergillus sergii]